MLLLIRRRALTRGGYSTPAGTASLASPHLTTPTLQHHYGVLPPSHRSPHGWSNSPGPATSAITAGRLLLQTLGSLGDRRRAGIHSSNYRSWRWVYLTRHLQALGRHAAPEPWDAGRVFPVCPSAARPSFHRTGWVLQRRHCFRVAT